MEDREEEEKQKKEETKQVLAPWPVHYKIPTAFRLMVLTTIADDCPDLLTHLVSKRM